jgi:arsenate reductase
MTAQATIYHNPRCSKSRQTLALLREHGIEPTIREYLKDPPNAKTVRSLVNQLGITPHEILRKKEAAYTEAGLSPDSSDSDVIDAIEQFPVLLERPIVVCGKRAAIGRPPENVLPICAVEG